MARLTGRTRYQRMLSGGDPPWPRDPSPGVPKPEGWWKSPPLSLGQGGDYTSMYPDPGVEVSRIDPSTGLRASVSSQQWSGNQPGLPDPGVQTQTTSQNPQYSGRAAQRQAAKEYVSTPGNVTTSVESTGSFLGETIAPGIQGLNSFLDGLDNLIASLRSW